MDWSLIAWTHLWHGMLARLILFNKLTWIRQNISIFGFNTNCMNLCMICTHISKITRVINVNSNMTWCLTYSDWPLIASTHLWHYLASSNKKLTSKLFWHGKWWLLHRETDHFFLDTNDIGRREIWAHDHMHE